MWLTPSEQTGHIFLEQIIKLSWSEWCERVWPFRPGRYKTCNGMFNNVGYRPLCETLLFLFAIFEGCTRPIDLYKVLPEVSPARLSQRTLGSENKHWTLVGIKTGKQLCEWASVGTVPTSHTAQQSMRHDTFVSCMFEEYRCAICASGGGGHTLRNVKGTW